MMSFSPYSESGEKADSEWPPLGGIIENVNLLYSKED